MEWNGDLRRATVSGFSGLQRKRQGIAGFRDSREEEGQMELQEMVRLRNREQSQKKDRDREFQKRRRVDRPQKTGGGESYGENEITESSDEEYYEEEEKASNIYQQNRTNQPPPSSLRSNNRRSLRTLRSSPVIRAAADEMFGFPIPRRARSTSIKRVHEHWKSAGGGFGEDLNRRKFSISPAAESPIGPGGSSPSSSGGSPKRKKMKSVEPRTRTLNRACNSSSDSVIQDDIEFEVAEALFDLMKQSQPSKIIDGDGTDTVDDELKRLKAEGDRGENSVLSVQIEQSIKVGAEAVTVDSMEELKKEENSEKEKFSGDQVQESVCGDEFLNKGKVVSPRESESPSCVKVNACKFQDQTVTKADCGTVSVETKEEAKLEIDLMAPLTLSSSLENGVLVEVALASYPKVITQDVQEKHETILKNRPSAVSIQLQEEKIGTTSSSQLPNLDVGSKQQQWGLKEQKNLSPNLCLPFPISMNGWPGVLPHPGCMTPSQAVLPMDRSATSSISVQTPPFKFSQPLRKKCTTHQYIALNIDNHLQLIKESLCSERSIGTNFYGMTQLNLNSKSSGLKFATENRNGCGKDKSFEVLNASTTNKLVPQLRIKPRPRNFYRPWIFPLGHHQTTMMAPANTSRQAQSTSAVGDASLPSNSALNLYLPPMSFNHQTMPIPPNIALEKTGSQASIVPFFNSSFYSSPLFKVSQNQQHLSSRKPPVAQKQTSTSISDNESIPDISGQIFSVPIQQMNALVTKNGSNPSINPTLNFHMLPDMPQKVFHASEENSAVGSANLRKGLKGIFGKSEINGARSLHSAKSGCNDVSAVSKVTIPNFQQQQHQQLIQLQKHHMQQMQLNGSSQGQKHISFGNMPVAFQGQHNYNSSVSKNIVGGLRNASNEPGQGHEPGQKSSPVCRRNVPSILSVCASQTSELKY